MTSLTLKPHLLRADTIDLQSHDNPSAKDHSRGQYHSAYNHTGAHHAQSLRNANQDALHERQLSPRMGGFEESHMRPGGQTHMYDDDEDDEDDHPHGAMNGLSHGNDYGDEDGDSQDEDMDDELLDKISSSPSIEDGKLPWPTRADSLQRGPPARPLAAVPTRGNSCVDPPLLPPTKGTGSLESPKSTIASPPRSQVAILDLDRVPKLSPTRKAEATPPWTDCGVPYSSSIENIERYLLPKDDPFLDNSDDELDHFKYDGEEAWEDEATCWESESSDDDDQDDFTLHVHPRFLDSGWGGECLRELEDIDFEFVYALHTFVATVEGQANATKGDTMVLLDDSNSYWWLVRVVKDGSIGYLPAEHIETPTERLARLNKHRNIDLSAAMLGDNPEKSKNPLKKAMRRRNAKTVNFAPPTYYEPDDIDWSDEEESDDMDEEAKAHIEVADAGQQQNIDQSQQNHHGQQAQTVQETAEQQRAQAASATIHRVDSHDDMDDDDLDSPTKSDIQAPSPLQTNSQDNVSRSRNGTVRNTDSFFKDQDTKKITLTPKILRNDNDSTGSAEAEVRQRQSLDTFDKIAADEKAKDSKKKEKKGMLSSIFKRKDKSGKSGRSDTDDPERLSEDSGRSPQSKESMESDQTPERKPSKLQKTPPVIVSPRTSPTETRAPQRDLMQAANQQSQMQSAAPKPTDTSQPVQQPQSLAVEQQNAPSRFPSLQEKRSVFAPIAGALRSKTSSQDMEGNNVKPIYSKRAKERFAIDESDSGDDSTPTARSSILHRSISPLAHNEGLQSERPGSEQRVSPMENNEVSTQTSRVPTADTKASEQQISQQPPASATPTSPSDHSASTSKRSPSIPTHTPSTSRSTPTWSDASLRSYMEDDQDIRDLLVIVHDKSNITPVGIEHPIMSGLFASERTKLADMQSQLDTMLLSWLSKKNQPQMSRV